MLECLLKVPWDHVISYLLILFANRHANTDKKISLLKLSLNRKIKYWQNLILILIQIQKNVRNIFLILSCLWLQKPVSIVIVPWLYKMTLTKLLELPLCRSFSLHKLTRDIFYRNYQNFKVQQFLTKLETNLLLENHCWDRLSYDKLTKIFKDFTEKHAALKKQKVRGKQTRFMTKQLGKQIIKGVNTRIKTFHSCLE